MGRVAYDNFDLAPMEEESVMKTAERRWFATENVLWGCFEEREQMEAAPDNSQRQDEIAPDEIDQLLVDAENDRANYLG